MTDNSGNQNNSYIDSYMPPAVMPPVATPSPNLTPPAMPAQDPAPTSFFRSTSAAPTNVMPTPAAASTPMGSVSQSLEDQNIFFLLGVQDGSDQEKESFLDELQQVIWEDFLDRDVELLITEEEHEDLKKIMADKSGSALDQQERIIVFLEKLIPDLEEIMLEKALELKEDMVRERIAGMREFYAGKTAQLQQLDQAENLINDDQWRGAAEVLNAIA